MATTSERMDELIDMLTRATNNKRLQWHATADECSFRLTSSVGDIKLTKSEEFNEGRNPIEFRKLTIFNDKGNVIEEYQPRDDKVQAFDELFSVARRSAYKASDVLDNWINNIKSMLPPKTVAN
jgi:hypothetical protein